MNGYEIIPGDRTLPPGDAVWDSATTPKVTPSADRGYYRVEGLPSWCGSDHPVYLAAYALAGTGESRASARAVFDFLLAEMPAWRRLLWRVRFSAIVRGYPS